jgi:hypothetical protein
MKTFTATSGLLTNLTKIIGALIPVAFGLAVLAFFWGVAKYILQAGNPKVREQGRQLMVWGVIALFVIASVWGLVNLLSTTFLGTSVPGSTSSSSSDSGCGVGYDIGNGCEH